MKSRAALALGRATKFALQNFVRNIWLSLVTVVILFLTLFSISLSASLNVVAGQAIAAVKDRVDVSIYFTPDALDEDIQGVQKTLTSLAQVKSVRLVTREEALQAFKDRTANNPVIQDTLTALGENPLGATLVVQAYDISQYPQILGAVDTSENANIIQDKDFEESQQVIERLQSITTRAKTAGFLISALFTLIAILVVFNTMRITIYSHRDEIGIMKLVGASNWFVRAPFVLESMLYAVIATALSIAAMTSLVGVSAGFLNSFFAGYDFNVVTFFQAHLVVIILGQLAVAVVLAALSSLFAVGRYLRV